MDKLESSDTETSCPYKGTTSRYYTVEADGERREGVAWVYDEPHAEARGNPPGAAGGVITTSKGSLAFHAVESRRRGDDHGHPFDAWSEEVERGRCHQRCPYGARAWRQGLRRGRHRDRRPPAGAEK